MKLLHILWQSLLALLTVIAIAFLILFNSKD
jgi:hypothetical protein